MLTNVDIQTAIQEAMKAREERTEVTQDMVVEELRSVAFAKAADYTDSGLKYANKLKALELLGKHLGMFTDRIEHSGEAALRIELGREVKELAE